MNNMFSDKSKGFTNPLARKKSPELTPEQSLAFAEKNIAGAPKNKRLQSLRPQSACEACMQKCKQSCPSVGGKRKTRRGRKGRKARKQTRRRR
jgi:hypothetical protein